MASEEEKSTTKPKEADQKKPKKDNAGWHIFAVTHKHILKLNGTLLCDKNYIMRIVQACYPWSSEGFKFKMHINMVQVSPFELPI